MNSYGPDVGVVRVRDDLGREQFYYEGSEANNNMTQWLAVTVQLALDSILFVIEASKGGRVPGEDRGDLCFDDVSVVLGVCRELY